MKLNHYILFAHNHDNRSYADAKTNIDQSLKCEHIKQLTNKPLFTVELVFIDKDIDKEKIDTGTVTVKKSMVNAWRKSATKNLNDKINLFSNSDFIYFRRDFLV